MNRTTAAALTLAAATAAATAGNAVVQTLNYDWNADTGLEIGMFDAFDTAGGTRALTGVSIGIDATAMWNVTVLNYSPTAYEPGEWHAEGLANFNVLLGEFGPNSVERIAGAISFNGLTGALGAGNGDPIFGEPGDPTVSASYSGFISNFFELDAAEFGVFTGGPVEARLLGFTDGVIDGPNGLVVSTDALVSSGVVTLTYSYANVPAPAATGLLALAGLGAARRRR
jgi:MYXO-CTERM domain-containing protein